MTAPFVVVSPDDLRAMLGELFADWFDAVRDEVRREVPKPRPEPSADGDGLITKADAAALLGVNVRTIKRLTLDPTTGFPPLIRISSRCVRLRRSEVEHWIAASREKAGGK